MKPVGNNGNELRSTFSVVGTGQAFEITFESGDGRGRNTDYGAGVDVVLERLSVLGATLTGARISSEIVMQRVQQEGLDPTFEPKAFPFPLRLQGIDSVKLRRALGTAGGRIGSRQDEGGNATRKMTLSVTVPGLVKEAAELERALAGRTMTLGEPLTMMTELAEVDAALKEWLDALKLGSRSTSGNLLWMSEEAVMLKASPFRKRPSAFDVKLGVRSSGRPWSVEINAPRAVADPNGLVSVATNEHGRRFVVRQGQLHPNSDSDGEIEGPRFRALSGLEPAIVKGVTSRLSRDWYVVAELECSAAAIRRQTGDFVHACAQARLRSKGVAFPPPAPPTFASDEKGGSFLKKAKEAEPEKEVIRQQGEVWLALRQIVERSGVQLVKLRHDAGYEVDGIILTKPSNILVEIKTSSSAADIYGGVGQLILYSRMLKLSDHRRILLLPKKPSSDLLSAVVEEGLMVHTYSFSMEDLTIKVSFSKEFLSTIAQMPR